VVVGGVSGNINGGEALVGLVVGCSGVLLLDVCLYSGGLWW